MSTATTRPGSPKEWISAIHVADEDSLKDLLNDYFTHLNPAIERMTVDLSITFRLDRTSNSDDVRSIIYETIMRLIQEVRSGKIDVGEFDSVGGLIKFRARSAVRRWMDSSEQNAASRQVNLKRRIWEMRQTRSAYMAEHGSEPSMAEVLDITNERMERTRSNARRQGMICGEEDYAIMLGGASVGLDEIADVSTPDPNDSDSELHASERAPLIKRTILACREHHPDTGLVAEIYLAPALTDDYSEHPSSSEISEKTGIPPSTVRRRVAEVKEIAKQVLSEFYGIEGIGA